MMMMMMVWYMPVCSYNTRKRFHSVHTLRHHQCCSILTQTHTAGIDVRFLDWFHPIWFNDTSATIGIEYYYKRTPRINNVYKIRLSGNGIVVTSAVWPSRRNHHTNIAIILSREGENGAEERGVVITSMGRWFSRARSRFSPLYFNKAHSTVRCYDDAFFTPHSGII